MSTPNAKAAAAQTKAERALRWRAFKENARAIAAPLLVYQVFLALMFGCFSAAALYDEPTAESAGFLGAFGLVTFTSVAAGQVLAILRVRPWVGWLIWGLTWTMGWGLGIFAAATGAAPLMIVVFIYLFLGPMFLMGGIYSLHTNRALFAVWVPLMYATGTAIVVAESTGKVDNWHAGSKYAIWDVFTFGVLALSVVLLLAYLVARETHRLHLWRRSARGPLMAVQAETGKARPRLSLVGWLMLGVLAVGLAGASAIAAPYLWRTGPGDKEGDGGGGQGQEDPKEKQPKDGKQGKGKGKQGKGKNKGKQTAGEQALEKVEELGEEMGPALQQGLDLLTTLLTMLVLFLLALLVFYRPVKRLLLIRHLRRPFWRTAPTARIEQGWRLVEIAFADAGVHSRGSEPAASLCRRGAPVLAAMAQVEVHGLPDAAEVRDRVAYGLGVHPEDVVLMERVADWAFDTVWERLGDRGQLRAMYRGL
jgi:hypothetical protein